MAEKYAERDETQAARDRAVEAQLRQDRTSWEADLRDLDDYIRPGRLRMQTSETKQSRRQRPSKIINSTGTIAHRTARSGLHSGMSSPARPWVLIESPDPDLNDFGPVKEWNHIVTERMLRLFAVSNLYNALPMVYGDELQFGGGVLVADEDEDDFMRCYVPPPGSYWLAVGARLLVDTYLREMPLTVRQIVEKYGDREASPAKRWEPFSATVRKLYEQGRMEARVDVMQIITPNARFDPKQYDSRFKRFRSCHYEKSHDEAKYLRESGYDEFPVMGPRWDVTGEDVYGHGPGLDALGDIKALQTLEKKKMKAIEKGIDPALIGPNEVANRKVSLLPGDVTALTVREGVQGLKAIHEVRSEFVTVTANEIRQHERRIESAFFADLFQMITQMEGVQPRNQIEMLARKEEKMMLLGPVLERQNDELFDPLVDRTFSLMNAGAPRGRRGLRSMLNGDAFDLMRASGGLIPPPPEELRGMPLKVEYVSILAQAQKLMGSAGLERFSGYVGNLIGTFPEVRHKVDVFAAIDEYGSQQGIAPKVIRATDEAERRVNAERAQAQQAAAAERAQQLAQGAKTLSETDISTPNALTALTGAPA